MGIEFLGDSGEYEMLTRGVELSASVDGLCLEIGTRLGLSAKTILDAIRQYCPEKTLVCVDPYGSILYEGREGQVCRLDYTNEMKAACMGNIWFDVKQSPVSFKYFDLTDADYFSLFAGGVPVYELERRVEKHYSFVFLDGPHNIDELKREWDFFCPRMLPGSIICYDDITPDFFSIEVMEEYMGGNIELVEKGVKKGLWRKVK